MHGQKWSPQLKRQELRPSPLYPRPLRLIRRPAPLGLGRLQERMPNNLLMTHGPRRTQCLVHRLIRGQRDTQCLVHRLIRGQSDTQCLVHRLIQCRASRHHRRMSSASRRHQPTPRRSRRHLAHRLIPCRASRRHLVHRLVPCRANRHHRLMSRRSRRHRSTFRRAYLRRKLGSLQAWASLS